MGHFHQLFFPLHTWSRHVKHHNASLPLYLIFKLYIRLLPSGLFKEKWTVSSYGHDSWSLMACPQNGRQMIETATVGMRSMKERRMDKGDVA